MFLPLDEFEEKLRLEALSSEGEDESLGKKILCGRPKYLAAILDTNPGYLEPLDDLSVYSKCLGLSVEMPCIALSVVG